MNEWLCIDETEWHDGVARRIAQCLRAGIESRGVALLAVSGGRSPIGMFQQLRRQSLAWEQVIVTLVDERWVPETHQDSNAALVQQHLLQGEAAQARFLPLYNGAATPHEARADCDAALRALPLPFDCVVLGMGEDGHTASFFTGAPELDDALSTNTAALCWPITPPAAPHARMTLSLNALRHHSLQLILPIAGKAKRHVYDQAKLGLDRALPVSYVLDQDDSPIDVWIEG